MTEFSEQFGNFRQRVAHIIRANKDSTEDLDVTEVLLIMESAFSTSLALACAGKPVDEYLHIVEMLTEAIQDHALGRFKHVHRELKAQHGLDT